ncbi:YdeI family protein [Mucilaginibacter sp.]|uniref:YdeI/OmpD-associated family protein n=1 Tax=Mucilaginibacter sp. TaxID=1882438 RepID=UPI0035BC32B4
MQKFDNRVDDYIARATEPAQEVLNYIREMVHEAAPGITETMKWNTPFFDYKGPVCQMATFKNYSSFGFWKATLLDDQHGALKIGDGKAGSFGPIFTINDLPAKEILTGLIKQAIALNENGAVVAKKTFPAKAELPVPDYFIEALKTNPEALFTFEKFSPSQKREYIEWVTEAKTDATRDKRLQTALEWIGEGKPRHWKYK